MQDYNIWAASSCLYRTWSKVCHSFACIRVCESVSVCVAVDLWTTLQRDKNSLSTVLLSVMGHRRPLNLCDPIHHLRDILVSVFQISTLTTLTSQTDTHRHTQTDAQLFLLGLTIDSQQPNQILPSNLNRNQLKGFKQTTVQISYSLTRIDYSENKNLPHQDLVLVPIDLKSSSFFF